MNQLFHLGNNILSRLFRETLTRQGQPAAMADPSTVGLSELVRQLQPDVISCPVVAFSAN